MSNKGGRAFPHPINQSLHTQSFPKKYKFFHIFFLVIKYVVCNKPIQWCGTSVGEVLRDNWIWCLERESKGDQCQGRDLIGFVPERKSEGDH